MNTENYSPVLDDGVIVGKAERIKIIIDSYLLKNPNLSLQSIENKSGLPISTLRRMISSTGNPNPENVVKLYLALGKDQELEKYLESFHPEIATLMASKSHNKNYEYMTEKENNYFTEDSSFLILSLAFTTAGTTEDEIRFELGERGVIKLNELTEKKLILKTDDGRFIGKTSNFKLPFVDVKKRIEIALKYYRLEEAGAINNFLNYQTESLSLNGLKMLKALEQKQAIERREQILNNKEAQGNFKIFIATISSTFVSYDNNSELLQ